MNFYVSLLASLRTCGAACPPCRVSHMVFDLHWPMCCKTAAACVRGPARSVLRSLIASKYHYCKIVMSHFMKSDRLTWCFVWVSNWSHTLREEHRLRVFVNRVLREYFDLRGGGKKNSIMGSSMMCALN